MNTFISAAKVSAPTFARDKDHIDYWYHSDAKLYPFDSLGVPVWTHNVESKKVYKTTLAGSIIED